jgi:hypothetical protein
MIIYRLESPRAGSFKARQTRDAAPNHFKVTGVDPESETKESRFDVYGQWQQQKSHLLKKNQTCQCP